MGDKSNSLKKLRRRIEDHLRKSSPSTLIKVADFLGVKVSDYIRKQYVSQQHDSDHDSCGTE
jgi:hypothetical protein